MSYAIKTAFVRGMSLGEAVKTVMDAWPDDCQTVGMYVEDESLFIAPGHGDIRKPDVGFTLAGNAVALPV